MLPNIQDTSLASRFTLFASTDKISVYAPFSALSPHTLGLIDSLKYLQDSCWLFQRLLQYVYADLSFIAKEEMRVRKRVIYPLDNDGASSFVLQTSALRA